MKRDRSSLITWGVIVGLLVVGIVLSAFADDIRGLLPTPEVGEVSLGLGGEDLPPPESEIAPITLDFLPLPVIQDLTLSPLVALGVLAGLTLGGIVTMGVGLYVVIRILGRLAVQTQADPEFRQAVSELEQKEKARLKALSETQPPDPIPDHTRSRWSAVSTTLVLLFFAIWIGNAVGDTFIPGGVIQEGDSLINVASITAWILMAVTLALSFVFLRPAVMRRIDASDNLPIPWGVVWAVVTGVMFVMVGSGLMLVMRGG